MYNVYSMCTFLYKSGNFYYFNKLIFLCGGAKSVSITNALVYMLVKDNLPLSSTEKEGFKYFMKQVVPMYKVPSKRR